MKKTDFQRIINKAENEMLIDARSVLSKKNNKYILEGVCDYLSNIRAYHKQYAPISKNGAPIYIDCEFDAYFRKGQRSYFIGDRNLKNVPIRLLFLRMFEAMVIENKLYLDWKVVK